MEDDITLVPIGRIHTPYKTLADCPRSPRQVTGTQSQIELFPAYLEGLTNLTAEEIDVLYWFDRAPRDILRSIRPFDGKDCGVFAMRSPHRPNPIALSRVPLLGIKGNILTVGGLDCLDGTRLIDIKPVMIKR